MKIKELGIKGIFEIQLEPHKDERGFFVRAYDDKIFKEFGIDKKWVQESISFSRVKGTIRGLHFQHPPSSETKVIGAITGDVFFAVVDLRKDSKTFGKWISLILSAKKMNALYVPRGCINGMCTLTNNCTLTYKMDNYYSKEKEDVIKWDDPDIGIKWPIKEPKTISERDSKGQSFKKFIEKYKGIDV